MSELSQFGVHLFIIRCRTQSNRFKTVILRSIYVPFLLEGGQKRKYSLYLTNPDMVMKHLKDINELLQRYDDKLLESPIEF